MEIGGSITVCQHSIKSVANTLAASLAHWPFFSNSQMNVKTTWPRKGGTQVLIDLCM